MIYKEEWKFFIGFSLTPLYSLKVIEMYLHLLGIGIE